MDALTYRTEGDYQIPNLSLPEERPVALGKYALLRKKYLKQNRRILYLNLLTGGTLNEHLMETEQTALSRRELLTQQMAAAQGVTEELKARDQMKWVGLMNSIRQSAEELILNDLIYV
jgi:hypothetical protein